MKAQQMQCPQNWATQVGLYVPGGWERHFTVHIEYSEVSMWNVLGKLSYTEGCWMNYFPFNYLGWLTTANIAILWHFPIDLQYALLEGHPV